MATFPSAVQPRERQQANMLACHVVDVGVRERAHRKLLGLVVDVQCLVRDIDRLARHQSALESMLRCWHGIPRDLFVAVGGSLRRGRRGDIGWGLVNAVCCKL